MSTPESLQVFFEHPEMFVERPNLDSIVAFLQGYDSALEGRVLLGFREYLIPKLGYGNNLAWFQLFQRLTAADHAGCDSPSQQTPVSMLKTTLQNFWIARAGEDGLQRINHNYTHWVQSQSWSKESAED